MKPVRCMTDLGDSVPPAFVLNEMPGPIQDAKLE